MKSDEVTCPSCGKTFPHNKSGQGTLYADKMKKPSQMHKKIMKVMLEKEPKLYIKKEIYELVNDEYPSNYLTVHGSISQLVRKNVFQMARLPKIVTHEDMSITTKIRPQYLLNKEYAERVLSRDFF